MVDKPSACSDRIFFAWTCPKQRTRTPISNMASKLQEQIPPLPSENVQPLMTKRTSAIATNLFKLTPRTRPARRKEMVLPPRRSVQSGIFLCEEQLGNKNHLVPPMLQKPWLPLCPPCESLKVRDSRKGGHLDFLKGKLSLWSPQLCHIPHADSCLTASHHTDGLRASTARSQSRPFSTCWDIACGVKRLTELSACSPPRCG